VAAMGTRLALGLVAGFLAACGGDGTDTPTETTGTPTMETGAPAPGDPVIVVSGPAFMPTRTSDTLVATIYNTDVSDVTWESDQPAVLVVDEGGAVSALTPGIATVTARLTVDGATISDSLAIVVDNEVPYYDAWRGSAHADYSAEAFVHWNEDDPREIPPQCAACHATPGLLDLLGADGSAPGVVDAAHPIGTAVECEACHNSASAALDSVTFPSGVTVDDLGAEAICMTCHQGRTSGDDLATAFATLGLEETPDAVSSELGFENVHYYPAAATLYAGQVGGGYEYPGQVYDWRFRHVSSADTCLGCHDQHSLELRTDACSECHGDVDSLGDVRDIRSIVSNSRDYDGDGDTVEGIYYELVGLRDEVYDSLQRYAADQGLDDICRGEGYPYYFVDNDGTGGACAEADVTYANRYTTWTPRLLAAAYNHQLATVDPGNFAHNAKYTIQLLHDSLRDLNPRLTNPKDLSAFDRNDPGHFDGAGEAARHWDEDAEISSRCSQCHGGAAGLEFYLEYGVGLQSEEPDNGLECETCHVDPTTADIARIRRVDEVTFGNGVTVSDASPTTLLCSTCHTGRSTKADVDAREGAPRFVNIHYGAAAASLWGAEVEAGYQYDGNDYSGRWLGHVPGDECTTCHVPAATEHTFDVRSGFSPTCTRCHGDAAGPEDIRARSRTADYDGDGDATESLRDELATLADDLYAAILAASGDTLCRGESYPYFFDDTNRNGVCDPGEIDRSNAFDGWTPELVKAVYNWQFWYTEPGAYAHNFDYMAQLLVDSIEHLGGDVSGYTRPAAD